jgi:hypothetical protein
MKKTCNLAPKNTGFRQKTTKKAARVIEVTMSFPCGSISIFATSQIMTNYKLPLTDSLNFRVNHTFKTIPTSQLIENTFRNRVIHIENHQRIAANFIATEIHIRDVDGILAK